MPRPCSVCSHENREMIDRNLVNGVPFAVVSRDNAVSVDAVERHAKKHLPQTLTLAKANQAEMNSQDLFGELRELTARAGSILEAAEGTGELRTALAAIREVRECYKLSAQMLTILSERETVRREQELRAKEIELGAGARAIGIRFVDYRDSLPDLPQEEELQPLLSPVEGMEPEPVPLPRPVPPQRGETTLQAISPAGKTVACSIGREVYGLADCPKELKQHLENLLSLMGEGASLPGEMRWKEYRVLVDNLPTETVGEIQRNLTPVVHPGPEDDPLKRWRRIS